jgi:uncharacterized protein
MKNNIAALIIAIAIIVCAVIAANAIKYRYKSVENITVTGLAEKDFTSDQIVWKGSFSRSSLDLKTAYASLKEDERLIKSYLNSKGIADSSIVFSSVDLQKLFNTQYDENGRTAGSTFGGYSLTGRVTVDSKNIALVEKVSREVTELLEKGVEFNSQSPAYYYTKLNELKIDLLAKASQDAKLRAETIAKNSGVGLGDIKKASMGVFQITGKNANEDYSYGGAFNTSAREKTASITLKVDYQAN